MREGAPGDITFFIRDTRIAALGIAAFCCNGSPKAREYGATGSVREAIGIVGAMRLDSKNALIFASGRERSLALHSSVLAAVI